MNATKQEVESWMQVAGLPAPGTAVTRHDVDGALRRLTQSQLKGVTRYITDQADGRQVVSVTVNTVALYLDQKYFLVSTPSTEYQISYNYNDTGLAPLLPGKSNIVVDVAVGDGATEVAQKTVAAIDASTDFICSQQDLFGVIIECNEAGAALEPEVSRGNTSFATNIIAKGGTGARRRFFGSNRSYDIVGDINPHTGGVVDRNYVTNLSVIDMAAAIAPQWSADNM